MLENDRQLARIAGIESLMGKIKGGNYSTILNDSLRRVDEERERNRGELQEILAEHPSERLKLSHYNEARRFLGSNKFAQLQGADRGTVEKAYAGYDDKEMAKNSSMQCLNRLPQKYCEL